MGYMLSYEDQLRMLAAEEKVDMLDAVKAAGIPTSTYYRSIEGRRALHFETAEQIARAIKMMGRD